MTNIINQLNFKHIFFEIISLKIEVKNFKIKDVKKKYILLLNIYF